MLTALILTAAALVIALGALVERAVTVRDRDDEIAQLRRDNARLAQLDADERSLRALVKNFCNCHDLTEPK